MSTDFMYIFINVYLSISFSDIDNVAKMDPIFSNFLDGPKKLSIGFCLRIFQLVALVDS